MSTNESNGLSRASAAFALSAAITVIFNTLLAWVKDSYDPLNVFMKTLSGHHWTTHGIVDVVLFVSLGFVFMSNGTASRLNPQRLVNVLAGSVVAAGLGLAAWFLIA